MDYKLKGIQDIGGLRRCCEHCLWDGIGHWRWWLNLSTKKYGQNKYRTQSSKNNLRSLYSPPWEPQILLRFSSLWHTFLHQTFTLNYVYAILSVTLIRWTGSSLYMSTYTWTNSSNQNSVVIFYSPLQLNSWLWAAQTYEKLLPYQVPSSKRCQFYSVITNGCSILNTFQWSVLLSLKKVRILRYTW
jgi:hypothetical protein